MENDFEQSVGWGTAVEGPLTNAKAHSGKWATAVNGEVNFGFTFERTAGRLAPQLPHRLRLRAWALRAKPGSTAKLVVQVNASATDTAKVFYGTLPLATEVREFDKWTAVSYPFTLPTSAAASNVIKIYLWRDQATAPTYLDDIALISEE